MQVHYLPFNERIIKSKKSQKPSINTANSINRPSVYKTWSEVAMEQALASVRSGQSVRLAAQLHGVPKTTLSDRVTGKVLHGTKSGPPPYLTWTEEELVSFLLGCAGIGYPRTRKDVLAIVQDVIDSKGIESVVTDGWWTGFKRRHDSITLRSAVPLSFSRAKATDPEVISTYFDILESTLIENDLLDKPSRIFNCDETGMPLSLKSLKVVDKVGSKNPSHVTGNTKEQVTVLGCVNASGSCMSPFIIFARKKLNPDLTKHEVPGTMYGLSNSGWMDLDLFSDWFHHHFLPHAPSVRPLLLVMDGHSTHFCPRMITKAAEEKVILFTLPPHLCHRLISRGLALLKRNGGMLATDL